MTTELVPFDPVQRSVAMAISDVEYKIRMGRRIGDNPYARAFFRNHFGRSNPSKSELICLTNCAKTIPEITKIIDNFLNMNGTVNWDISDDFKYKAFPSLKSLDRFEARYELKAEQTEKIESKAATVHQALVEKLKGQLLKLNAKGLGAWVSNTEDEISQLEQHNCLRAWFKENVVHDWTYSELYDGMKPSQVAYDLSFDDF